MKLSNNFFVEIDKQILNSRTMIQEATNIVTPKFEVAKRSLIEEFQNDPVSQEISTGPYGPKSKFLQGPSDGNLFSFIGFDAGDNPIGRVVNFLQTSITMTKRPKLDYKRKVYRFVVYYPTVNDSNINKVAPMPRGTSLNWLYAIERGISGINSYLFDRSRDFNGKSNSGSAIEAKIGGRYGEQKLRSGGRFNNQKYFTTMINRFIKRLQR